MASKSYVRFYVGWVVAVLLVVCPATFAQFTANIQGIVQDPSRAGLANAKVDLVNAATHVSTTTTADGCGNYRFGSLQPGSYSVTAESPGFVKTQDDVTLMSEQTLNVPITLTVGAPSDVVDVSTESPVVVCAECGGQRNVINKHWTRLYTLGA